MSHFTEERLMVREAAREFAMKEVLPLANKLDPQRGDIPRELLDRMAEMGWFGMTFPEEHGGMGMGCFEYCIVAEELCRAWMSVGSVLGRGNMLHAEVLNEEQRRRWMPRMARGELLGSAAISEPNVGSDVAGIQCRAVQVGDEWEITGNKYWCTFADQADFILVYARTSPPAEGKTRHNGISALIVEKPRGQLPQGCQGAPIPKIGYFGMKTWELSFDRCRVPDANMLGREGRGFHQALHHLDHARAHTAARSIGVARGALEDALAYSQEREQFGQPISEFQVTRFKLADMATEIEAARQLMYHVCGEVDAGRPCTQLASMAKLFASEMSERVTSEALQIFGGAGYTTLHAAERYWRDARLTKIFEGTSEIQKRIISDHLLRP